MAKVKKGLEKSTSKQNSLLPGVGQRIREFRQKKNLSLVDFASSVKASASLISQIENGKVQISMTYLKDISEKLSIPVAELLYGQDSLPQHRFHVMTDMDRKYLKHGEGVMFSLLSSHFDLGCELMLTVLAPGASTGGGKKYTHEGVECSYLLEGHLEVELGNETIPLNPGESITYRSDTPHCLHNRSKRECRFVTVDSKPFIFTAK